MKRTIVLIAVIALAAGMVYADGHGYFGSPEGQWNLAGTRLYQKDAAAPRAKAWMAIPQNGSMVYEFTVRYEGGGEDGHGGVGIHILGNSVPSGKSWGLGDSWLLWFNYDVNASAPGVPKGLSAQVYKSDSNKKMEVVKSIALNPYVGLLSANLDKDIPVKLTFLADKGRVIIADPTGASAGWYVDLPGAKGDSGNYVAVRTNSVDVSFTSPDVKM